MDADLETQRRWQRELADRLLAGQVAGVPAPVEVIGTHLSQVFLTEQRVYKLKKPLHYSYLDYSSARARRRCCVAEVRLNRRLAPWVYLGVAGVSAPVRGAWAIDGGETPLDSMVVMRRLPAGRSLDRMLDAGQVEDSDLDRLGARLAAFHGRLPPARRHPESFLEGWRRAVDEQRRALVEPRYGLEASLVASLAAELQRLRGHLEPVLRARLAAGRVVDGHGDLRPEHVYLVPEPVVIDCLEFSRRLRTADAADELAFLSLECRRQGNPAAATALEQAWVWHGGDRPPQALMRFYRAYRALLWAKLAVWHLDRQPDDRHRWVDRAGRYLSLAAEALG